ncbi:MAG: T9SS type A sorting domain-containing protein [Melioribacteraceae bacterium]|nr:T9SS type A sorting domain-containing protein [Melioribacteraceae bacterium]
MVVRNEIANSPSDAGGERSVSNALMVVSTEPEGSLHQVKLNTEFAKVFWDDNYQFTTTGYDEYFNSTHQLNNVDINYSISHDFGAITSTGLFTAGILVDTGYVITEYNGLKDSALVVVNSIKKLIISPSVVVTDTTQTIDFSVQSIDLDGVDQKLSNSEFQWSSTNSFTGVVDSIGVFTGLNSGVTEIIVRWENVSDTAIVSVELENGSQVLSSFDNINDWYLTGDDIDSTSSTISITSETSSEGNESLRLDYQFTYQSGVIAWAYLNTDIQVSGVPANLGVDVKSDGQNHSIAFVVEIYGEDEFALLTHKTANVPEIFEPIWSNFDSPIPIETSAAFHFPIFIKQIAVILGSEKQSGETYNGTIYFDNLRAVYPDAVTNVENQGIALTEYKLYQNYPNPFNPSTTIKYEIPDQVRNDNLLVSLKVYDILGREVATLVNKEQSPGSYEVEFNASSVSRRISSGIYFYRLNVGGNIMSKKMLLLK